MRKVSLAVAAALVLVMASVTLASASGPSSETKSTATQSPQVFELLSRTIQRTDLDLGKKGFGQSDQFIFHDLLFRDGNRVGTADGACQFTYVTPQRAAINCVVTLSLPQGQLTIQGVSTFPTTGIQPPFFIAITGGTGAYKTAHGQVRVAPLRAPTDVKLTVHLIL